MESSPNNSEFKVNFNGLSVRVVLPGGYPIAFPVVCGACGRLFGHPRPPSCRCWNGLGLGPPPIGDASTKEGQR